MSALCLNAIAFHTIYNQYTCIWNVNIAIVVLQIKHRIITITKPSNCYINSELSAIKICQSLALNTYFPCKIRKPLHNSVSTLVVCSANDIVSCYTFQSELRIFHHCRPLHIILQPAYWAVIIHNIPTLLLWERPPDDVLTNVIFLG